MTDLLIDASVALKWFHAQGEAEVDAARAILAAHRNQRAVAYVLDLTFFELGNAVVRALGGSAHQAATILSALGAICTAIAPSDAERTAAARLAVRHHLTFYDASYAAVASARGATLVTADRALLSAGLGESPTNVAARIS